jgi:hypothetical protein
MGTGNKEFPDVNGLKRGTADLKMLAAQLADLNSSSKPSPGAAREPAEAGSLPARKRSRSVPS